MSNTESVSRWIAQLHAGETEPTALVWRRYYQRLVTFARRKMSQSARRTADEEDVVSQAFNSFFRRINDGGFPQLRNRQELWRLLARMTHRKAIDEVRRHRRIKRSGGDAGPAVISDLVEQLAGRDVGPQDAVSMQEQRERLLNSLDESLRVIAEHKLQGYTNVEIAARIQRSVPTVERRWRLARQKLQREVEA